MKVVKKSTSQLIIEQILEQIENGSLISGDKLPPEREMAEQLGVSRGALREAICAMVLTGIIESRQGGGNYISSYQPSVLYKILRTYSRLDDFFLNELFEARAETEAVAARLAARNAGSEDLKNISKAVADFSEAVRNIEKQPFNYEKMIELDIYVHLGIAAASHNGFYIHFVELLHKLGYEQGNIRKAYENNKDLYKAADTHHCKILRALENGDEKNAYDFMLEHISDIKQDVEKSI